MGELLLCNESIAAMPFYFEGISLNIYSIEELSYYISRNVYLIDKTFMSEDLCTWIGKELKLVKLSEKLRDILHDKGKLSDFVLEILNISCYCTTDEIREITLALRQLEEKSDFECNKIRADRLMESNKYLSCIYEYKRLLEAEDVKDQNAMLVGNIYHNLGTAYARLFLFEEAKRCYQNAYDLNDKKESLKELLMTYRCLRDEVGFLRVARDNGLNEIEIAEIKNELSVASRNEKTKAFEEKLEAIAMIKDSDKAKYKEDLKEIISIWKDDYRKINRV